MGGRGRRTGGGWAGGGVGRGGGQRRGRLTLVIIQTFHCRKKCQ